MKLRSILAAGLIAAAFGAWSSDTLDALPAPWYPHVAGAPSEQYLVGVDHRITLSGRGAKSVRSITDEVDADGFATAMQTISAENYAGQRLRFAAMVRVEDVKGWSGLWMRIDADSGRGAAFDNMGRRPIRGTSDWKQYEIVLDVPADARVIAFGLLQNGSGQSWMDELSMEIVDDSVPVTAGGAGSTSRDLPTVPVL